MVRLGKVVLRIVTNILIGYFLVADIVTNMLIGYLLVAGIFGVLCISRESEDTDADHPQV